MFARQLCRRIPGVPGLRPVALRPTLSGGLPLSGCEFLHLCVRLLQGGCHTEGIQVIEKTGCLKLSLPS